MVSDFYGLLQEKIFAKKVSFDSGDISGKKQRTMKTQYILRDLKF